MSNLLINNYRKHFGIPIDEFIQIPHLIKIQVDSYKAFLQCDVLPELRQNTGMQQVFTSNFPIVSSSGDVAINFISYRIDPPIHTPAECKNFGSTYCGSICLTLEINFIVEEEVQSKVQEVYIGEIPFMTENATFIINGSERIVVSQLHRSPGLFFEVSDQDGAQVYTGRLIPVKGVWLDFEIDERRQFFITINKRRIFGTTFLMALLDEKYENSKTNVLAVYYTPIHLTKIGALWKVNESNLQYFTGKRLNFDLLDGSGNRFIASTLIPSLSEIYLEHESLLKFELFQDVIYSGTSLGEACDQPNLKTLGSVPDGFELAVVYCDRSIYKPILTALRNGKCSSKQEALLRVYTMVRPNDQLVPDIQEVIEQSFFSEEKYDLSRVGRLKVNQKLRTPDVDTRALLKDELFAIIHYLLELADTKGKGDEPDSLEYRRVRSAGELVKNQFQQSMAKFARSIQERLVGLTAENNIIELINSRHLATHIREFFGTSPLSQLADQTNLLSELSHIRRLSSFGQGGLNRNRPWMNVRGLHGTHYGRVCVVETPEGNATGLVNSLTLMARVDEYGFVNTPYRPIKDGKILDHVIYMSTSDEEDKIIAYYDKSLIQADHSIRPGLINCRKNNEQIIVDSSEVEFMDTSPKQILSVSSALIPFIENNDTTRAVYGANMQRQALPLISPTAPLVATGIEKLVVNDSGTCIKATNSGVVKYASSTQIIIENDTDSLIDTYYLTKFQRSNDSTLIDHIPEVRVGDVIAKGQIIANAAAVDNGEIALGRNVRIAFHSWRGGNYEDAILISSRMARNFRSIGLTKFEISARMIKQEVEKFTRDIPNLNEEFVTQLDERGIICIGAKVKAGDILVGRVTPKSETNLTPDERLLKAVFGDKAIDVKDTSLRVPPGMRGTVVDVRIFTKRGIDKTPRELEIEQQTLQKYHDEMQVELKALRNTFMKMANSVILKQAPHTELAKFLTSNELDSTDELPDSGNWSIKDYLTFSLQTDEYRKLVNSYRARESAITEAHEVKIKQFTHGHTLQVGVLEMVQVFIATEYQIQPGDKVAGRHGNKGIISKVMNPENMPYTKDGEIVDMLFTSTGISGRMNIGQILETHLGWASVNLGKKIDEFLAKIRREELYAKELREFLLLIYDNEREKQMLLEKTDEELIDFAAKLTSGVPFACPVFESPSRNRIKELLTLAGCDPSGKEELYDGETGLKFPQKVTVGVMYVMQLHHLVEKKEHARSVGPYSIVTLQPLGGKAQMGGQRFGEMEVWTLQAYAAAYTTRETLTVKSDYPLGRARIFELISQGYDIFDQKGIPESFCVLLYELRSLCLKVDCLCLRDGHLVAQELIGLDNFDALRISIASPAQIRSWSYGEVQKSETIHYASSKPHPDGIFSTRIFGPIKDYQCLCGKHRGTKRKGIICSKCNTEVTTSKVRRYRMGHIELVSPVAHIWFSKVLPSRIAIVLNISTANLNRILKFEAYLVVAQGLSPYPVGHMLTDLEASEAKALYDDTGFEVDTGPEVLETLLKQLDLVSEIADIRSSLDELNEAFKTKAIRRLKILEAFYKNNAKPEHMILRVIPVMPPDLRPLVAIEGGRFASSDLNELYRRIINRNNRLAKLLGFATPGIIIRNEKRMLQEAVDALFDNSRRSQPLTNSTSKRPLKSIGDSIKGKQGRFRQNLLGKRVDYSGRSVIIVGPNLKLHQCGLPKTMALELFKPFVLARLVLRGFAPTIRIAKMLIESSQPEVWEILAEVTKTHVVLINRAPTLHRLGIQAFEPVLIEGRAIQLHPLTCRAFNADFDGDQVGVHVPLSIEAQLECRLLMMSTKCILNPSNGTPIATPTKDIVLGLYALTCIERGFGNENLVVSSIEEAENALFHGVIRYTTPIKALVNGNITETTYGRMKLFSALPTHVDLSFDLINKTMTLKEIQNLTYLVFITAGEQETAGMLDKLMRLGFEHATLCGATFAYSDLPVPEEKEKLISQTQEVVSNYYLQYKQGLIREEERHNKITSAWAKCTDMVRNLVMENLARQEPGQMMNPIYMIAVSGARGSTNQLGQVAGMRGILARVDGSVQEDAIKNSLIEGMTVQEYTMSAQGARKGLADTALKTAKSGYLTRIIADTAQDCITQLDDCGTTQSIELTPLIKFGSTLLSLGSRAFGRAVAEDILDDSNSVVVKSGTIVDLNIARQIDKLEINSIRVRSPITCIHNGAGICCKCYGYDLSNLKLVKKHVAVGIIAAQSIGEPGTQLTLRNFQSGGAAQNIMGDSQVISPCHGSVDIGGIKTADRHGQQAVISRNNLLHLLDKRGKLVNTYRIPHGAIMKVHQGQSVSKGDLLAEWDPYVTQILAEYPGIISFKELVPTVSCHEVIDYTTGVTKLIITNSQLSPSLVLKSDKGETIYPLVVNDTIVVENGTQVPAGAVLAERSQEVTRTQDIVGGLPLIADLLEARTPKNAAVLVHYDGVVEVHTTSSSHKITVRGEQFKQEVSVSLNSRILVEHGDTVKAGDLLTEGRPCLHDLLKIKGFEYMARYLTDQVQHVYQEQGITISDKHIEIILRQMLGSGVVIDPGDSTLLRDDVIRVEELRRLNELLIASAKKPVEFRLSLHGISRAAILEKTSFFASASFQETAKELIKAAIGNKIDCISGMKEALITGKLIPAGIGGIIMHDIDQGERKELERMVFEEAVQEKIL